MRRRSSVSSAALGQPLVRFRALLLPLVGIGRQLKDAEQIRQGLPGR